MTQVGILPRKNHAVIFRRQIKPINREKFIMSKISIRDSLQTKQILGNELNIEKKIIANLNSIQKKDGKKPFPKIADQVVIEPYKRIKASTSD